MVTQRLATIVTICIFLALAVSAAGNSKSNQKNNNNIKNNQNKNNNNNNNNNKEQSNTEIWEQDLSDTFKIEGSDQGIQKVNLKCGSNSMNVMLETEKPFSGVMYTRGSFYKQAEPCFMKPTSANDRTLEMNFQFDQCQTLKDGDLYSNIVVIQNDPEVITPGDSAFSLECDFRQPRSLNVEASMQARDRTVTGSKITLTSPDPSAAIADSDPNTSVHSDTDTVAYVPKRSTTAETINLGTVEDVTYSLGKDEFQNATSANVTQS